MSDKEKAENTGNAKELITFYEFISQRENEKAKAFIDEWQKKRDGKREEAKTRGSMLLF